MAATLLAANIKTPLQIGHYLVRVFEAGFDANVKPVDAATIESILSRQIDDLDACGGITAMSTTSPPLCVSGSAICVRFTDRGLRLTERAYDTAFRPS